MIRSTAKIFADDTEFFNTTLTEDNHRQIQADFDLDLRIMAARLQ